MSSTRAAALVLNVGIAGGSQLPPGASVVLVSSAAQRLPSSEDLSAQAAG